MKQITTFLRGTGWALYFFLLLLRFVLVWRVQPGYIHPDEFFQSLEISAGDVYGLEVFRSWEFLPHGSGPLRSIAGIGPMAHLPVWLYKRFLDGAVNLTHVSHGGSDLLTRILFPVRFMTAVGSLWVDLFVLFGSAHLRSPYGRKRRCFLSASPPIALLIYASCTFGGLLFAGRTIANAWETAAAAAFGLFSLVIIRKAQYMAPTSYNCDAIFICILMCLQAAFSIWAIFIRFTYPLFILPLGVAEIAALWRKSRVISLLSCSFAVLVAALSLHLCLLVDTAYYKNISFSQLYSNWSLPDLVCVPCRFFAYNSNSIHLAEHGLHPRYLHLLVNLPLIIGPVVVLLALCPPKQLFSVHCLFWLCVIVPLAILSTVPHQEARFLMPLIPFVAILAGHRLEASPRKGNLFYLWRSKWGTFFTFFWFIQQTALLLLFGTLHQGGLVRYFKALQPPVSTDCRSYIFYHTYMPPRFPFGRYSPSIPGNHCNTVTDLMGSDLSRLRHTLQRLRDSNALPTSEQLLAHLIYPGSVSPLGLNLTEFGSIVATQLFFGHLSLENLPHLPPANHVGDYSYWYSQLSLHVVSLVLR